MRLSTQTSRGGRLATGSRSRDHAQRYSCWRVLLELHELQRLIPSLPREMGLRIAVFKGQSRAGPMRRCELAGALAKSRMGIGGP